MKVEAPDSSFRPVLIAASERGSGADVFGSGMLACQLVRTVRLPAGKYLQPTRIRDNCRCAPTRGRKGLRRWKWGREVSTHNSGSWILWRVIAIATVLTTVVTSGCGRLFPEGSSLLGGSGVSVFITSVKFGSLVAGASPQTLNAQIVGDSTNAGVIWTLTANGAPCSDDCGFLSGITPTSANYTPPAVAPATPANAPKITATAVADTTQSDSDSFTINAGSITVTITNKVNAVVAGTVVQPITFMASTLNDSSNKGVTWSLASSSGTCTPGTCGTITTQTPVLAVYQPPTSPQTSPVTITATSAASGASASDSDTFTILASGNAPSTCNGAPTGKESLLNGSYAFFAQGTSVMAASFAADNTGKIKDLGGGVGGEIDINAGSNPQHFTVIPTPTNPANPGSFYTVGPDGTGAGSVGCLSLYTSDGATRIFRFALGKVNSGVATEGRITEFDDQFDPSSNLGTRASGPLRLQDPTVFASGNTSDLQHNYAFGVGGGGDGDPHAVVVGAFVLDPTTGVITNSDFDSDDLNTGIVQSDVQGSTGSIGSVSTKTGRSVLTLTPQSAVWPGGLAGPNKTQAALYVVNSSELFLVTADPQPLNPPLFLYAGRAIATGNAFSSASLSSGNFILHETGTLAPGACNQCADVSLGLLSFASGNSSVSGKIFEYSAKNGPTTTPLMGSATYTVSSTFGRVTLTGTGITHPPVFYLAQPTGSTGPTYAFVGGTDPTAIAASGLLEPGASAPVTTANLGGKSYFFGDEDDPADPTINNRVGVLSISSTGGIAGTQFTSGPTAPNLLSSGPVSIAGVSIDNANGFGTGNVGTNTVAITDGSKLFFIDEAAGTPASITVVEPQ